MKHKHWNFFLVTSDWSPTQGLKVASINIDETIDILKHLPFARWQPVVDEILPCKILLQRYTCAKGTEPNDRHQPHVLQSQHQRPKARALLGNRVGLGKTLGGRHREQATRYCKQQSTVLSMSFINQTIRLQPVVLVVQVLCLNAWQCSCAPAGLPCNTAVVYTQSMQMGSSSFGTGPNALSNVRDTGACAEQCQRAANCTAFTFGQRDPQSAARPTSLANRCELHFSFDDVPEPAPCQPGPLGPQGSISLVSGYPDKCNLPANAFDLHLEPGKGANPASTPSATPGRVCLSGSGSPFDSHLEGHVLSKFCLILTWLSQAFCMSDWFILFHYFLQACRTAAEACLLKQSLAKPLNGRMVAIKYTAVCHRWVLKSWKCHNVITCRGM